MPNRSGSAYSVVGGPETTAILFGRVGRLVDDSRRNEELLASLQVNHFVLDKESHGSSLHTEALGKSRVYVKWRTRRMRVKR